MALLENALVVLAVLFLVIAVLYNRSRKRNAELESLLNDTISRKQSLSTKYGKMTEQFMPFLETYPYDKQNFRFIGSPIDGVQFEKDKIIFVEFKAGNHSLTILQKEIRDLVEKGKVRFEEIRMK